MAGAPRRSWRVVAAAAVIVAPGAAAKVPTTQSFHPSKLGISFTLPSDWAGRGSGLRFQAIAPARIAQLDIAAVKTDLPLATAAASFVRAQRATLAAKRDTALTTHRTKIETTPAIQVTDRYYGLGVTAPAEIHDFIYLFAHGGLFYVVGFTTTSDRLAQEEPIFRAAIRSLRFVNVA